MATPDYIVCLSCETPCYVFEWKDEELKQALCEVCGNEEVEQFANPEMLEGLGLD